MRRIACFFDVLSHHSRMVDLLPCQRDPGEASRLQFVKARFHETNSRGRPAQFHEENCHLTEPPPGSFSKVGASEFLWLDFNDIAFLRTKSLQGGGGGRADLTEWRLRGNKPPSVFRNGIDSCPQR